jgi:hypothetical protein
VSQRTGADGSLVGGPVLGPDDVGVDRPVGHEEPGTDRGGPIRTTGADASATAGGATDGPGGGRRTAVTVGAITAVLAVPLVIATVAVRSPRWYPLIDLAQIEMRVRDVGLDHPPLVGLGGRIFAGDGTQGSHPGPLSFYLLAPVYRLAAARGRCRPRPPASTSPPSPAPCGPATAAGGCGARC